MPTKTKAETAANLLSVFFTALLWALIVAAVLFFFSGKLSSQKKASQVRLFLGVPAASPVMALKTKESAEVEAPKAGSPLDGHLAAEVVTAAVPPVPVETIKQNTVPAARETAKAVESFTGSNAKKNLPSTVEQKSAPSTPAATILPPAPVVVVPEIQEKPKVLAASPEYQIVSPVQSSSSTEKTKAAALPLVVETKVDTFESLSSSRTDAAVNAAGQVSAPASTDATQRRVSKTWTREGHSPGVSYQTVLTVIDGKEEGFKIQLKDGNSRRLLSPAEPIIILSQNAEKLVESSKTLIIQFKVLSLGSVPMQEITFSPASVLPEEILSEIKVQLAQWNFEPAGSSGQVALQYSIKKL